MSRGEAVRTGYPWRQVLAWLCGALLLMAVRPLPAFDAYTSATKDMACAGTRINANIGCTANEFNVNAILSAAPGTPPFCMAGQSFDFIVDITMTGGNTSRYDVGFFAGQTGNDPQLNNASNLCSVAPMPNTPSPWVNDDSDSCGDNLSIGTSTVRVDEIKVVCQGDTSTGALQVPYVVSYRANKNLVCNVNNVAPSSQSKCNSGTAIVAGNIKVYSGAWVDITKQTEPDGNSQPFTFTATGPADSKVIVLTGATLTNTTATGGTYSPASISDAVSSRSFTLQDGQTARVFVNLTSGDRQLSIVETAVAGWDPTATISCAPTGGTPSVTTNNATRTVTAQLNQNNYAVACTVTNTKRPTVTLTKVSNGGTGTFTFTGNNSWTSQDITTVTPAVGVAGATQVLPQNTATTLTESLLAGWRVSGINCTGLGAGGSATYDTTARSVALNAAAMAPGSDIACTFTNQRQRTLTVNKILSPVSDPGLFVLDAAGTLSAEGGHGTSVNRQVDVGSSVTAAETAGTGTALANYTAAYSCNTAPVTSGNGATVTFTMPNADVTCGFTNTRRSASLTLAKAWQNAISGNSATVSSSGFINNATSGLSTTTGNNTTTGGAVTVYAGESGTLGETWGTGDPANYTSTLGCTGSSGLSGNTLTVDPADSAIACTYTNARKSASLTLRKAWVGATVGDTVEVTSSGFTNDATSGVSVSTGNNTTTGTPVTVYAAESGTISEQFTVGNAGDYTVSLACTGTSGLSGSTLTVAPADSSITCTFTNSAAMPLLSVLKLVAVVSDPFNGASNPKSVPGAITAYRIRVTNSGTGPVDADTLVLTDPVPANAGLYVGDLAGPGSGPVAFTDGTPASGLNWVFNGLADLTDSVDFSSDNGVSWNYVPLPDVDGFDTAVTHIRLRPQGALAASGGGDPWFEVVFRVRVQ